MSTADPMQQFHFAPMPSSPLAPHPTTPIFSTTMTSNSASMFNFSPTAASNTQSPRQTSRYQPTSPSRLSPQRSPGTTTTTTPTRTPESTNTNANTYAQRYATIAKPLQNAPPRTYTASASPSARTARRNLFLNRIKQDRDTGRFETRGEQLVLMEHAAEQKMWWEAMRRRADGLLSAELGVLDEEEMGNDPSDEAEVHALDEYLAQERAEMELVDAPDRRDEGASFSDDEYEGIFMDLAESVPPAGQDMDMSG